jgi:hypothetical protein
MLKTSLEIPPQSTWIHSWHVLQRTLFLPTFFLHLMHGYLAVLPPFSFSSAGTSSGWLAGCCASAISAVAA